MESGIHKGSARVQGILGEPALIVSLPDIGKMEMLGEAYTFQMILACTDCLSNTKVELEYGDVVLQGHSVKKELHYA